MKMVGLDGMKVDGQKIYIIDGHMGFVENSAFEFFNKIFEFFIINFFPFEFA